MQLGFPDQLFLDLFSCPRFLNYYSLVLERGRPATGLGEEAKRRFSLFSSRHNRSIAFEQHRRLEIAFRRSTRFCTYKINHKDLMLICDFGPSINDISMIKIYKICTSMILSVANNMWSTITTILLVFIFVLKSHGDLYSTITFPQSSLATTTPSLSTDSLSVWEEM